MKCLECGEEMKHICDEKGCGWICEKCSYDSREKISYGNIKSDLSEIAKELIKFLRDKS